MKYLVIFIIFCFPFFSCTGEDSLKEQARIYREEGYKLQEMGDPERALVCYQKAVQIDPYYAEAYNDLGVVYENLDDEGKALRMYEKALETAPQHLPAYTNLAFFYENKGDIEKASYYWEKRYELGVEGEYWKEVARQHLLRLGTYPQIKREILEKAAVELSRELVYSREQKRLKAIEEAKLRFDIGSRLFLKEDYQGALKEFETAFSLNPDSEKLKAKLDDFYKKAKIASSREEAIASTTEVLNCITETLNYIKNNDFHTARKKLEEASSTISRISLEE